MVPLSRRTLASRTADAPNPVYELLARIREADTPYQAWAAVALAHSGDARHRPTGRDMMRALRAELPIRLADWEHGDVACFATLAHDLLTSDEREQVVRAIPAPHDEVSRRSRFYASPLYVYLTTRGLAGNLPEAPRLAAFVGQDALQMASRSGSDLPSLVLQLATVLELQADLAVDSELVRAAHARLIASAGEPEGAIAVRWLLARYDERWPTGEDAAEFRVAAMRYAATYEPTAVAPAELRPEVAAMRLETLVAREGDYRLVRTADVRREVASAVNRRHIVAAGAYAITLAVIWGAPAWALAALVGGPGDLALGVALMAWAPSALWATLWEYGRLRRDGALAGATALALAYYGYFAYVVLTHGTLELSGKDAIEVIGPVLFATMFGAAPALRESLADGRRR